jgi:hypothetical protein
MGIWTSLINDFLSTLTMMTGEGTIPQPSDWRPSNGELFSEESRTIER